MSTYNSDTIKTPANWKVIVYVYIICPSSNSRISDNDDFL